MQTFLTALQKTIKKQSYILVFINILDSHLINYDNVCVTKFFWGHIGSNLFLRPFRILVGSVCISFRTFQFWGFRWALQPRAFRRNFTWNVLLSSWKSQWGWEGWEIKGRSVPRLSVRTSVLARSATWVRRAWSVRDRVRVGTCCILARGGVRMGCCSYLNSILCY